MTSDELREKYTEAFENLSKDKWKEMSIEERTQTLQQIENFAAMQANRPAAKVELSDGFRAARGGYYNTDENKIIQNIQRTRDANPKEAVTNILHEGRHAYQYDCIQHPDKHPEVTQEKCTAWEYNFAHYITPGKGVDFKEYYNQPVEKDARDFARSQCRSYVKGQALREEIQKSKKMEVSQMANDNNNGQKQSLMQRWRSTRGKNQAMQTSQNQTSQAQSQTQIQKATGKQDKGYNEQFPYEVHPEYLKKQQEKQREAAKKAELKMVWNSKRSNSNNSDDDSQSDSKKQDLTTEMGKPIKQETKQGRSQGRSR